MFSTHLFESASPKTCLYWSRVSFVCHVKFLQAVKMIWLKLQNRKIMRPLCETLFFSAALLVTRPQHSQEACIPPPAACNYPWCQCRKEYSSTSRAFFRSWWGLTEVPQDIPAEAVVVYLAGNEVTSIPDGVFSHLTQCNTLNLGYNKISALENLDFSGMGSLQSLWLGFNQISEIQSGVFVGLKKLTSLWLENNQISSSDAHAFSGLESLVVLVLKSNKLSVVEQRMFAGLKNLNEFNLDNNGIYSIADQAFRELQSLEVLHLSQNKISILPEGLFMGLKKLRQIILTDNQISVIQLRLFAGLFQLTDLSLNINQITYIEEGTFDSLFSTQTVSMEENRLTTLSPDVFLNLPRQRLQLFLSRPFAFGTNMWDCSSLCWLKHEEHHGTIIWSQWVFNGQPRMAVPRCAEGDWSSLQCGDPGKWDKRAAFHVYIPTI